MKDETSYTIVYHIDKHDMLVILKRNIECTGVNCKKHRINAGDYALCTNYPRCVIFMCMDHCKYWTHTACKEAYAAYKKHHRKERLRKIKEQNDVNKTN